MKKLGFTLISIMILLLSTSMGCNSSVELEESTGSIMGKVVYTNENVTDYSGIQVTLFSTNGLMPTAYCTSRGITTNARSVEFVQTTSKTGEYLFENIPEGVYTIYASSNSSTKKAVATNIEVRAAETVTAEELGLTATGSISGQITIDYSYEGVLGLDVFIAGTSFIAKVRSDGYYTISDIPAQTGYELCVQKGEKTISIISDVEVRANETTHIWNTDISSTDWESNSFTWRGSFEIAPENPKKYEAYYNSLDGCSYIYNGSYWELFAKAGTDGEDGKDGVDGKDGNSIRWRGSYSDPILIENPQYLDAYYNETDGCSYIYTIYGWEPLALKGDTGIDGTAGKGINWRGSFSATHEINDPQCLDAYYNTTDGCSYIYNGEYWTLLAKKGDAGTHINWLGEFDSNNEIPNPQHYDAYFNKTDGCSYIYIYDQWQLLARKGDTGTGIHWLGDYSNSDEIQDPQDLDAYFNTADGCSYIYYSDYRTWVLLAQKGDTGEKGINWRGSYSDPILIENPQYLDAYYNETDGCSYIYTIYDWEPLALKGDKGNDGITIRWCGSFADPREIEEPQLLWAYYNTTDGCSYIYDGSAWQLLARKGTDAATGSGDGGIRWLGTFNGSYEISTPAALDAYFNKTDGCSYIYNGTNWILLAQAGEDGKDGIDGTNGKDGLSINWLGSKTCHEDIHSPKKLDAYWNTTENCAYIYNGYSWNVLVKGPGSEGTGSSDPSNSTADAEIVGTTLISWKVSNPEGAIRIPNGVTDIADGVFKNKDKITSVIIPSTVVTIGKEAFYDCDGLTSVQFLGSGLETIGASAFESCGNLASIILPNSLKVIDTEAFYGCGKLNTIIIPNSVIKLGSYAFSYCSILRTVTIGSSVKTLEQHTFSNCDALVCITIPSTVTAISYEIFHECNNLNELNISGRWEYNGNGTPQKLNISNLMDNNYSSTSTHYWTRVTE